MSATPEPPHAAQSEAQLVVSSSNPTLGDFNKIPRELRDQIWLHTLVNPAPGTDFSKCHQCTQSTGWTLISRPIGEQLSLKISKRTAILRTSRAIYDEALPVLVSATRFQLSVSKEWVGANQYEAELRNRSEWVCQCRRTESRYVADWRSWNMIRFVRDVDIWSYMPSLQEITSPSAPPGTNFCEVLEAIAESLQTMNNIKYFKCDFRIHGPEEDLEEAARLTMMPFLRLRGISNVGVDIRTHLPAFRLRADYVERIRQILTSPKDGEAPSIEGMRFMERHNYETDESSGEEN